MDNNQLFQDFYKSFVVRYPHKNKASIQAIAISEWSKLKSTIDFKEQVQQIIEANNKYKSKGTLSTYFKPVNASNNQSNKSTMPPQSSPVVDLSVSLQEPISAPNESSNKLTKKNKPAQDSLQNELEILRADQLALLKRKNINLISEEQEKNLKRLETREKEILQLIKKKQDDCARQQKLRDKRKEVLQSDPDLRKRFCVRDVPGRPRLEVDQPDLLKTIVDLVMLDASAHEKRREESLRSIKSLEDLKDELGKLGFILSKSGLYLRLLPRKSNSIEGKKHINTVPVKLIKAACDEHKSHDDTKFCRSSIKHIEEICSFLGPSEVCVISQDDKAKVPIGITASTKQSPMMMHVEYRVQLPDHRWVVGNRQKINPSVYAGT